MEAIMNQPTVLNGTNGTNALIFGKDLSGQTLSGTYTLIACVGSVTVTSGKFYLYNCSGLVVTIKTTPQPLSATGTLSAIIIFRQPKTPQVNSVDIGKMSRTVLF